jgi:hypothetical protein
MTANKIGRNDEMERDNKKERRTDSSSSSDVEGEGEVDEELIGDLDEDGPAKTAEIVEREESDKMNRMRKKREIVLGEYIMICEMRDRKINRERKIEKERISNKNIKKCLTNETELR